MAFRKKQFIVFSAIGAILAMLNVVFIYWLRYKHPGMYHGWIGQGLRISTIAAGIVAFLGCGYPELGICPQTFKVEDAKYPRLGGLMLGLASMYVIAFIASLQRGG